MSAADYRIIQRSLTGTGGWASVSTVNAAATTFKDTGLTEDTTYYYRIIGVNDEGTSPASNVANATTASSVVYNDIVAMDGVSNTIQTYTWDGTDWSPVGSSYNYGLSGNDSIGALAGNAIALTETTNPDEIEAFIFDGSTWSPLGTPLAQFVLGASKWGRFSDSLIARYDPIDRFLYALSFDGSTWTEEGNSTQFANPSSNADISALNSTDVAFVNNSQQWLRTYRWNGTSWAQIGNSLATGNSVSVITFPRTHPKDTPDLSLDLSSVLYCLVSCYFRPVSFRLVP